MSESNNPIPAAWMYDGIDTDEHGNDQVILNWVATSKEELDVAIRCQQAHNIRPMVFANG